MIERDQLAHEQQIRFGKEQVRPEPLGQPLRPRRAGPAQIADVTAAERRQSVDALRALRFQRLAKRLERLRLLAQGEPRAIGADPDVAVASERSLEEEGIAPLLLVEKAEDAERRQQITGKFDGGGSASKACSGKGVAWRGRLTGVRVADQARTPVIEAAHGDASPADRGGSAPARRARGRIR